MTYDDLDLSQVRSFPHRSYRLISDLFLLLLTGDRQVFQEFNLTNSQYRVLTLLDEKQGQRLTVLSDRMLVTRSTITRLIDQMEGLGWIKRVDDPEDRRAQQVTLTPAGAALRDNAYAAHETSLEQRFSQFTEEDQRQLAELLLALREHLRIHIEHE